MLRFHKANPRKCSECKRILDIDNKRYNIDGVFTCPYCGLKQKLADMIVVPSIDKNIVEASLCTLFGEVIEDECKKLGRDHRESFDED